MIPKAQLDLLKFFIGTIKADPKILHSPELQFFRDWLVSLGANIPTPPASDSPPEDKSQDKSQDKVAEEDDDEEMPDLEDVTQEEAKAKTEDKSEESEEEDDDIVESDVDLEELEGVIKDENTTDLEMGDDKLEVTEAMEDEANTKRSEAMTAMSDGRLDEAIVLLTEAIKKNPHSANLYAKRACILIKSKRPLSAIKDCEKALTINKDSAQPYKWRGRAYRLLGKYEEAYHDFQTACRLDFDESAFEWQKEVEKNAKKIMEHRRKYERLREEQDRSRKIKEAKRRKAKAQKEYERKKKENESRGGMPGGFPGGMPGGFPGGMGGGFPGGMPGGMGGGMPGGMGGGMPGGAPGGAGGMPGGGPGGMPDMSGLFSDPDLMAALQDPEVMAAFQDVSSNPANMSKYQDNPKVKSVIEKLQSKFGGAGGPAP